MKRILSVTAALLLCTCALSAQTFDALEQVRQDWRKRNGMEGPHRLEKSDLGVMSKAPKGYKPFYISHYGRHGSRTAWNSGTYTLLHEVFDKAHNSGNLTRKGEEFYKAYEDFYVIPHVNSGDLVPLGFEQHKKIGEWTYDNFPRVFRGNKKVNAVVSTAQRSIVSMSSFCLSLKGRNPKLDIYQESNHMDMTIAAPTSAPKLFARKFKGQDEEAVGESASSYGSRIFDYDRFLGEFFKDLSPLSEGRGGQRRVCDELMSFITNYHNITEEPIFDHFVSLDDQVTLWEINSYSSYMTDQTARWGNIPLLEDVIAKADEAIADPRMAANLRFGHDYVVEAFMCLINANNCGKIVDRAEEAKYWFQSYNIPMATTVLFVFYKNSKNDVIFKLVWNEHEASLPQLTPLQGNYYRWADFKAWAQKMMEEHPDLSKVEEQQVRGAA